MRHRSDGAMRPPTPQLPAFCRSRRPICTAVQVRTLRHLFGLLWLVLAIQLSTLLLVIAGPVPPRLPSVGTSNVLRPVAGTAVGGPFTVTPSSDR